MAVTSAILAGGCISTADRTGDRAEDRTHGFWAREGLACWRLLSAPAVAVRGLWECGEELCVGATEVLFACQFKSCAYPLERVRAAGGDVPREGAEPVVVQAVRPETDDPWERELRRACGREDWASAAKACRMLLGASRSDREKALNGVRLAMANWNAGDKVGATIAMDLAIDSCSRLGEACEAAARALRGEIRTGLPPERFPADAIVDRTGLPIYDIISQSSPNR